MEQPILSIRFKKLDEKAIIPSYAHKGDVGMDLTAIDVEYDRESDMYIYHTGLAMETPQGFGTFIFPRSSNRRTDAYLCNHVAIIDSAIYRGELMLCFKNRQSLKSKALEAYEETMMNEVDKHGSYGKAFDAKEAVLQNPMNFAPYKIGERIAQMVVMPYPQVQCEVVDELSETDRGANGFGSSGK